MEKQGATVSRYEVALDEIDGVPRPAAMGTVTIAEDEDILLVPSPSADPRDPLNLSRTRKIIFVVLLSIFSSLGLSLVSGFGGLLAFYIPQYAAAGKGYGDISALMTFPSMFMGVGNLIGVPLAMAVGRRPVYLAANVILIAAAILAAYSKSYEWHLAARMVLGLAAGQSEALVPMMIQEVHFLHERSTFLMVQSAGQTIVSAIYCLFASPIAGAIGPSNWYNLGSGLSAIIFILSVFLVPESKYDRSLIAYGQVSEAVALGKLDDIEDAPRPVTMSHRPAMDLVKYKPRTLRSDMTLFANPPDWMEGWYTIKNTFEVMLFPNVFWAFCLNGLTLGINIAIGTTYSSIVTAPPYNWANKYASYVNTGQIVTALVALPLLGNGSDWLIKRRARRNNGVHEPENRLLMLWIPVVIGIISCVLYGEAGAHPERFHWFAIVFAFAGYYFCFVGANIAAITYLLDAYPARAAPMLVVICAFRGFVSFGTSYGVTKFIATAGYDGSFGAYAGMTAFFGVLGIPVFLWGKCIRRFTGKWAQKEMTGKPSMAR
ncbi:hypothetical protein B0A55_01118 [Friedmanniomyces simplex]|uniref:Major facilitator superfamily (MFS) profile domain-containing protein n=1 Tax=Friedmanniomyces simplex TaxID=329884 RepID=A0A4U0Y2C7_9PEZI|nr:hypothetical protein B0A55_01118 [Friedmanniomyces simplex]